MHCCLVCIHVSATSCQVRQQQQDWGATDRNVLQHVLSTAFIKTCCCMGVSTSWPALPVLHGVSQKVIQAEKWCTALCADYKTDPRSSMLGYS